MTNDNTSRASRENDASHRGTVIRYVSQGTLALTDAIQSGMLSADVQRICENVAEENQTMATELARVKRENAKLRDALTVERCLNKQHIKARMAGYKAVLDDKSDIRWMRDFRLTLGVCCFAGACLAVMLVTVCIAIV